MLTKFLITAVIVLVVWYGFKWVGRLQKQRREEARRQVQGGTATQRTEVPEDMIACPTCGDYVAPGAAVNCGRDGCPYPG